MHGADLFLGLLIAVAALVTLARWLGIAYPIFLVIGGLLLGLVPGVPRIQVDPQLIFLIVLPPLLYRAAYFTPVRNLRAAAIANGAMLALAGLIAAPFYVDTWSAVPVEALGGAAVFLFWGTIFEAPWAIPLLALILTIENRDLARSQSSS